MKELKEKQEQLEKEKQEQLIHDKYSIQAKELRQSIMRLLIEINGYVAKEIQRISLHKPIQQNNIDSSLYLSQFIHTVKNYLEKNINEKIKSKEDILYFSENEVSIRTK